MITFPTSQIQNPVLPRRPRSARLAKVSNAVRCNVPGDVWRTGVSDLPRPWYFGLRKHVGPTFGPRAAVKGDFEAPMLTTVRLAISGCCAASTALVWSVTTRLRAKNPNRRQKPLHPPREESDHLHRPAYVVSDR